MILPQDKTRRRGTAPQADERRLGRDMYEVDNRYPEIMPLYSKVSGGKSYGALHGATAMNKAKRTSRISKLPRTMKRTWFLSMFEVSLTTDLSIRLHRP